MLQGWRLMLETVIDDIHPPLMKMEAEAPSVSHGRDFVTKILVRSPSRCAALCMTLMKMEAEAPSVSHGGGCVIKGSGMPGCAMHDSLLPRWRGSPRHPLQS